MKTVSSACLKRFRFLLSRNKMQKHTRLQDTDPLSIATGGSTLTRIILSSACFLVAACGGGGGDTSNNPTVRFDSIRVFSDGGGVGRSVNNLDGAQAVFISPYITEIVSASGDTNPIIVDDIERQISALPAVKSTPTGTVYEGAITSRGVTANVYGVVDNGGQAAIVQIYFPSEGERMVLATGTAYGGIPSGEFTYQGTQGIVRRVGTTPAELGTFSLTANFGNQTFSYDGTSTNSAVSGSGRIDTVNGRFATNALDVTAYGTDYTGTMHGLLHGSSSQSVSGVFHTNDDNPDYAGAFVGSR